LCITKLHLPLLAHQDLEAARQVRAVVGQVEQAQWLRLEARPATEAAPPVPIISI